MFPKEGISRSPAMAPWGFDPLQHGHRDVRKPGTRTSGNTRYQTKGSCNTKVVAIPVHILCAHPLRIRTGSPA